jgi:hypothetical protein
VLLACCAAPPSARAQDDLAADRDVLGAAFAADLEDLTDWCRQRDLAAQAERTHEWAQPLAPGQLYFVELPAATAWPPPPDSARPDVRQWMEDFRRMRQKYAADLFDLALRAARGKRFSLAAGLVQETLRQDPDHERGRKFLGYQRYRNEWRTAHERKQLAAGRVWHDRFGWLAKKDVPRYEAGERWANGRWVTAEQDAELHGSITSGWKIETDHYRIRTNHSLEEGARLGSRLEALHRAWRQLFLRFFASEADSLRLIEGKGTSPLDKKRHEVVLFSDQEEYQQYLVGSLPAGVVTTGIYLADHKTAYFYAGREDDSVLFHEATHQLFGEARPAVDGIGLAHNFWVIEGIACYMESFAPQEGYWTVGGRDAQRFLDARYRRVNDNFYVPLAEFCALGRDDVQRDERIGTLYSQAAGLAHFLMHGGQGRHRDALVRYLDAVYAGRDRPDTLAELAALPMADLDSQYLEFVTADDGNGP